MVLDYTNFALTIDALETVVPYGLSDETLYLTIKEDLIGLLTDKETTVTYFGYAADNTADGQDELLTDGVFFRIIGYEKNLGIDLESSDMEIIMAFKNLVENYKPFWTTIIVEEGFIKKEITIELLYRDVFV